MAEPSRFGDKAYTLEFKTDGTIVAYTWVTEFAGKYNVGSRGADVVYKINIADFYKTEITQVYDESETEWRDGFRSITSFELSGNELTLLHNNGSLVYRSLGGTPTGDPRPDAQFVSYKKYSLEDNVCAWREDRFESNKSTVLIINNESELESYVGCRDGGYPPPVDFSKSTLLLAVGMDGYQNTPNAASLTKLPGENKYVLEVNLQASLAAAVNFWQVPVVVDKIAEGSEVQVVVMRGF